MTSSTVLIFGEGDEDNDRRALEHLIHAFAPINVSIRCKRYRSPIILDRGAKRRKSKRVAEEVAVLERGMREAARRGERVVTIGFHDCDALEPAHVAEAGRIEEELRVAGVQQPIAATPAWSIEAWWMLFPEALALTRGCWKDYRTPANVGAIQKAKETLRGSLRPIGQHRCPDYHERDSITIARHIRERRLADDARTDRSASLAQFRDALRLALTAR